MALQECEGRLRDLTELSSDWWWEQDAQFRFVDVSKSSRSHGGIPSEDHFGRTHWELPNTEPVNTTWKAHKAVLRARKPFRDLLLRRIDKDDGSEHFVLVNGKPLCGPDGGFRGYRGVASDVSGRIAAERALRESEAYFRATFEQVAVGIAHTTPQGRFTQVNNRLCEMLGYTAAELQALDTRDLTHPDDRDRQDRLRQGLLAGKCASFSGEKRYLRKDGSVIWVNRTVTVAERPSTGERYLIQVIEEITGRIQEEAKRREIENRFRATFEQAAVGIVHVDLNNRYLQVNRKFCEMVGHVPDELVGRSAAMISYADDIGKAVGQRRRLLAGEIDSFKQEKRYRRKDGATIWVTRTESLARGEDGAPLYFIRVIEDITDRKALERQFQTLFEQAAVGIVRTDFERNILEVNRKFCEMIGYDREELLRMDMKKISHPDDLAMDTADRGRLLSGEIQHFSREKRYVCRDGKVIWGKRTVSLACDTFGNPEHFIFVIEDVTGRKEAEEAVARERALLRSVVDAMPERIYVKDREGRFLLQNATNLKVRGIVDHDEIVGKTVFDIFPRDMAEKLEAEDRAVMVSGVPLLNREGKTFFGDPGKQGSSVRWHVTSKVPLKDGQGRVFGLVGVNRDITDRKRVEEELRDSEEIFRVTFSQANVGIAILSPDFDYLQANDSYCAILGYAREELLGMNVRGVNYPEDAEQSTRLRDRVISGEIRIISLEKRLIRKDGSPVWVSLATSLVRHANGEPKHFITVMQDISERKEAEQAMRDNEELYRNLFERAPLPLLVMEEKTHKLLEVNHAALEKYGYRRDEFLTMSILDLQVAEDRARVEQELHSRDPHRSAFFKRRHVTKGGELLFVEVTARPFVFQGRQSRMLLVNDVTERLRAETALRESEELFHQLAGNIPQAFWISDVAQHRTIYASPAAAALIGRTLGEILSDRRTLVRAVHKEDRVRLTAARRRAAHGGYDETYRIVRPDGSIRWVHDQAFPVRDAEGNIYRIAGIAEDITERRQAEEALRESEEQFRQLANNIPQIFWITDVAQREMIYVSPAYERITGRPFEPLRTSASAWLEAVHEEDRERVRGARREALSGNYDEVFRVLRPDGTERWLRDRAFPVRDAQGDIYRIAGIAEDITDRRDAEERLMYLAHYDALTSLPNRVLFYDRLKQALAQARRNEWVTAVMFLDLDRFKNVNDTLGHTAGDQLLRRVSERVAACVRSGDTVGRLGGDEFALVLSNLAGPRDASLVAHKIMSALSEPFQLEANEVFVTASIGITLFPSDSADQDTLIRNADAAMYRAKELGRNGCQFYTPEMNARALEKLSLESSLRRALERKEFLLYYQPKASLASGEITGMEALLRWRHPELGLISPSDFMPMLEETGLVVPTGEWVIHTACRQIRAWQQAGIKPVPIAVNLSARQFQAKDLGENIARILEQEGVAHGLLELEITESSLIGNTEEAVNTLTFLNSLGIRIAIDDFGTGYSSLSYLKRFPLDSLKIDGSFVRDITTDADDAAITRAIITMAHNLDLSVVAEGVETEQQLNFLYVNGCDEIQGYYFTWPLPADEVTELLRNGLRLQRPSPDDPEQQATVLLVDDDEDSLMLLKRELGQDGYKMFTATSAREGLEILGRHNIRVVVSDYSMPGMSGAEFLQKVKSLYPDTLRIMLSGHTDFHTVTEAVNKGEIYRFVAKNWNSEHLRANIRQGLLSLPRDRPARRAGDGRPLRAT